MAIFYLSESSINYYKKIKSLNELSYNDPEKIILEYQNEIYSKFIKNKEFEYVKKSNYKGYSIDIKFKKDIKDQKEYDNFYRKNIINILKDSVIKFEKKYNTNFYWSIKVVTESGMLIVLDSDILYK